MKLLWILFAMIKKKWTKKMQQKIQPIIKKLTLIKNLLQSIKYLITKNKVIGMQHKKFKSLKYLEHQIYNRTVKHKILIIILLTKLKS